MSANLPSSITTALDRVRDRPNNERLNELAATLDGAGSAAERADKHVQLWREGMMKLMLELSMREDVDEVRAALNRMEGFKTLKRAALESAEVMAELRSYWNPSDKVRT